MPVFSRTGRSPRLDSNGRWPDAEAIGDNSLPVVGASNLLTADGTFAAVTGWTVGTGWTINTGSPGNAEHTSSNTASLSGTSTATDTTKLYKITFTLTVDTEGDYITVSLGDSTWTLKVYFRTFTTGTYNAYIKPTNPNGTLSFTPGAAGTFRGHISAVSIKEVTPSDPDFAVYRSDAEATSIMEVRQGPADSESLYVGHHAGEYALLSTHNTAFGWHALRYISGTGSDAEGVGGGSGNLAFGNSAMENCTDGSANTAVGNRVLRALTSGENNTAIGTSAMRLATTASNSIAIGAEAMSAGVVTGNFNTAIGAYNCLYSVTSGYGNMAFGSNCMLACTTGYYNIAIGDGALQELVSNTQNTIVGYEAASKCKSNGDVVIGFQAYKLAVGSTGGDYNVIVGAFAADKTNCTGYSNTIVGGYTCQSLTSGNYNVIVGYHSGNSLTSGHQCIAIGFNLTLNATESNQLNIGGLYLDADAIKTTVNGSTAGTIIWSQPFRGKCFKKVVIYLNAWQDAGEVITFTTAFTYPPAISSNSTGIADGSITLAAGTCTLPDTVGSAKTGFLILEGF